MKIISESKNLQNITQQAIIDWIIENRVSPGEKLLSDREFAQILRVSSITVTNAFSKLAEFGIVEKRSRIGTFVVTPLKRPAQIDVFFPKSWKLPLFSYDHNHHSYYIYRQYLDGIIEGGNKFSISVCVEYVSREDVDDMSRIKRSISADGIVFIHMYDKDIADDLTQLRLPNVVLNLNPPISFNALGGGVKGISDGLDHLYELGHRDIGAFVQDSRGVFPKKYSSVALYDWAKKHDLNIDFDSICFLHGVVCLEEAYEKIYAYCQNGNLPSAILSESPIFTRAFLKVAEDLSIKIPEDVSLLNISPPESVKNCDLKVSSVDPRYFKQAYEAMRKIAELIEKGGGSFKPISIDSEYIRGDTCIKPKKERITK